MTERKKCGFTREGYYDDDGFWVEKECNIACRYFATCTRSKYTKQEKLQILAEEGDH